MQEFTHWIEVDLDALVYNFHFIKALLPDHLKILAVVKADAYGLGAGPVARLLEEEGVDMLGVTHLEEGILLRREGVTAPVLLFSPLLPQQAPAVARYQLTPTLDSPA
ncbi:MAG TPA: alanine racemase, partial [Clostridia bacterium]|nr:alanine racemase [Clostridia bacterium]